MKIKICRTPPGVWQVDMQGRGREWHGESFASRHLALQALALQLQNYPLHLLAHVRNGVWIDPLAIPQDLAPAADSAKPKRAAATRTRRRRRRLPLVRDETVVR